MKSYYWRSRLIFSIVIILSLTLLTTVQVLGFSGTLLLFDDFDGTSLNTTLWYENHNSDGASALVNDGILTINSGTTLGGGGTIHSNDQFLANGEILVLEMRSTVGPPAVDEGLFWGFFNAACQYAFGFGFTQFPSENGEVTGLAALVGTPGILHAVNLSHIDTSTWHTYRVEHTGNNAKFYIDGILEAEISEGFLPECPLTIRITRGTWPTQTYNRTILIDFVKVTKQPYKVEIDIKPGSDPSCFNSNEHGVIPVVIFGNSDFDVMQIDVGTVSLDGAAVAVRGKADKTLAAYEDVNGDGYLDLVVKIIDLGGYSPGNTYATLKGTLYDGTLIEGVDDICITQ